jgi:monoamine oxidase
MELFAIMEEVVQGIDVRVFDEFPEDQDVSLRDWIAAAGYWEYPSIPPTISQLSTSIVGREPREIGAHYFFDYLKSGNGTVSLLTEGKYGAQSLMIKSGMCDFFPLRVRGLT